MAAKPPVSIVIRALNEAGPLGRLISAINQQNYDGLVEFVVVDNESNDDTVAVAKKAGAKVVTIKRDEFSYPHSMNLGVAAATYELVVLTVAHAWPVNTEWLSAGVRHFQDARVAGVYSPVKAPPGANIFEKLQISGGYRYAQLRGSYAVSGVTIGVFGATNSMLRRSLWEKYPFNEAYGAGGEDGDWATWALKNGYQVICDYRFAVYHSHGVTGPRMLKRQQAYWASLNHPRPFDRERLKDHRNDPFFD